MSSSPLNHTIILAQAAPDGNHFHSILKLSHLFKMQLNLKTVPFMLVLADLRRIEITSTINN